MRLAFRAPLALALLIVAASPALAVQEWYDYYLRAVKTDIPARSWSDCVANLDRALRLRPASGTNVRTYGVIFEDYLPHYYRGLCLLRQESYDSAVDEFNAEEKAGAIKRTPLIADLIRLRGEAQSGQHTLITRRARAELDRMVREARERARAGAYDEALSLLKQAEQLATGLDTERLHTVRSESERLRAVQKERSDALARSQRLEQRIAEGQRLLGEGKPSDAKLAFDEAHDIDPNDVRAIEGRRVAAETILGTTTRENRRQAAARGKALFEAGEYQQALAPLTEAAADPENAEARTLIARAQKTLEGVRQAKEASAEIGRLVTLGEKLMGERRYPDAQVAFESVLGLDPQHPHARERLAEAARRTGEALFARWLPNREPMLTVLQPERTVVQVPSLALRGVATDDRGISKVEFRLAGRLIGVELPLVVPAQELKFGHELPLAAGENRVEVTAIDDGGLKKVESFTIERRLRFHETTYFLPSALAGALGLVGVGWGAQRLRRRRAVRRRFNPYIAGAPVLDEHMFYGREKLTRRMLSTLHRNSLMITGERRIGKTTFLHHLKRVLAEDEAGEWKFFPVFVDLQGVPEHGFFHAMMAEVVDGLAVSGQTRESLRFRPVPDGYDAREFSHDLPLVLGELRARTPKKVKLALLIDEVDVLNEYSESVNQRLRGIFMKSFSENLVAVMSGVAIRRRWKSEVSPWYNFFDEIELSPFTREDAEALIREPVAGVFRFRPAAVERILELSGLRPYFIQKYCVHAVTRMLEHNRTRITVEDVEAAQDAVEMEGPPGGAAAGQPVASPPVAD